MAELSAEEAVAAARRELGLDGGAAGSALRVRRLDREGAAYYLVMFGDDHATVAVAALDADDGRLESAARLPGRTAHLSVGRERARELAGLGQTARAELVWAPCRATRSQLYPLWEVSDGGARVFVDQRGGVWRSLDAGGPGG
ncbi:MAG TPA: hypothetical protein VJ866_22560 [Pyrinomonadaceae bacterium]|nr:hypothetical protein [Pyrinomonadaceae bacterium]